MKGIYQSCDVFFYTLGEKLGIDRIAKYATALGMGQKTGIDLPQEVSGVMPSEEWKIRNFKQKWFAGETISVGIGQGAVAATPIQMARAFGAIASGGRMVRPHVTNPTDLPPGIFQAQSVLDEVHDSDRSQELGNHYRRDGAGGQPGGNGGGIGALKVWIWPARPAARRP